ncbi:hypothetical protein PP175_26115 (plasmid) [Aneurinibacillus sp. Ricciae_BoGa-3]|uniref:hypothetical protein n=1 Tax=Aneurinibacillus sp. Ricciae_BoGa-3 TaxID=3022697 RepID=UPI0023402CF0|nr:hypothetical protein [Aneurinibacillus sp. Ricciae_BoGa-3]WCK57543.1 hypothetical protein PP175_26115 [Aneurinibacillus sp. Ricciae_BoGa-3]
MSKQEEIIKKYEEFANYLTSVNLEELKSTMPRQVLKALHTQLYAINLRSLGYEIGQMVEAMKQEEYPELLGVHHYPDLRDIDFMSEQKKIQLDDYLVSVRKGNIVYNFWRFVKDTDKLQSFLVEKGIIEEVYYLTCPYHNDERLTSKLTLAEFNKIKEAIQTKNQDKIDELLDGTLLDYCDACGTDVEFGQWDEAMGNKEYRLIKDRDKSLDYV